MHNPLRAETIFCISDFNEKFTNYPYGFLELELLEFFKSLNYLLKFNKFNFWIFGFLTVLNYIMNKICQICVKKTAKVPLNSGQLAVFGQL